MEERREFNVVERVSGSVSRGMLLCCLHQASIGERRSENCFSLFLVKWFETNGGFWGVVYVYWVGGESDIGGDRMMLEEKLLVLMWVFRGWNGVWKESELRMRSMRDGLGKRFEAYRVNWVESGFSFRKRSMREVSQMFSGRSWFWSQGHCLIFFDVLGV